MRFAQPRLTRAELGAVAFVLVFAAIRHTMPTSESPDFPITVLSGLRVAAGEVPYRDFNVLYGPLGHYILGAFLRVSPFVPRTTANIFFFLNATASCALILSILRTTARGSPLGAWLPALGTLLVGTYAALHAFYSGFAFNLILSGTVIAGTALAPDVGLRRRVTATVALAMVCTATVLTRVNFGAYLIAAFGLALCFSVARKQPHSWRLLATFAAAGVVAALLTIGTAAGLGLLRDYIGDVGRYISRFASRELPLTATSHFTLYLTIGLGAGVALLGLSAVASKSDTYLVFLTALTLTLLQYSLSRFDGFHNYPFLTTAFLAAAVASSVAPAVGRRAELVRRSVARVVVIGAIALGTAGFVAASRQVFSYAFKPRAVGGGLPRAENGEIRWRGWIVRSGFLVTRHEAVVLDFLSERFSKGTPVFHAAIPGTCECTTDPCVNVALYLIAGTVPRPRYWFFDAPSTPYAEVQQTIAHDLERYSVAVVAFHGDRARHRCLAPVVEREASILYDHVRATYRHLQTLSAPGASIVTEIYVRPERPG